MKSFLSIIIIWILLSFSLNAAETLQLSTQDERNLLLRECSCNWKIPSYPSLIKGKYIFKIENIDSNSITGKFDNTFCPAIRDFKGNINKDSFGFEIKGQTNPCVTTKITAKLFREKNRDRNWPKADIKESMGQTI